MDNWLKGLVAAACVVVVAGGGYYAFGEYQRHLSAAAARQQEADTQAMERQVTNSPEYMKCRDSLNSSALGEAKRLRDECRQKGYITYDEQLKAEGVR